MKLIILILGVVLLSSLVMGTALHAGDGVMLCGREVSLINTGMQGNLGYGIFSVYGDEVKIFEGEDERVSGVEIYVEGVADDVGAQYDTALVSIGCKTQGKIGIRADETAYELHEGDTSYYGGREFSVVTVESDHVVVEVDNDVKEIYFNERKRVGGLSVYVHRISGNEVVLKIKSAGVPNYLTGNSVTGMVVGDVGYGFGSYFSSLFSWLGKGLFSQLF